MTDGSIPYYVHDLNPVIVHVFGPLAIRWYGLAYLAGFLAGWWLLRILARRKVLLLPESEAGNFVMAVGLWGVLVSGRLGSALFYDLGATLRDPLSIFRLWEGGMSSHGGFLGVAIAIYWSARKNRVPFWNLADGIACVAPVGLFFGRLANFINGELWGRVTNVVWAVIFPTEANFRPGEKVPQQTLATMLQNGQLHPRHPSQLYEALGEGLILFAALWALRNSRFGNRPGIVSVSFLAGYATIRIACEFFREPDGPILFGWMSKGQQLSLFMYLGALAIWLLAPRSAKVQSLDNSAP